MVNNFFQAMAHHFFLIFLNEVRKSQSEKNGRSQFLKKNLVRRGCPKRTQKWSKYEGFRGLTKSVFIHMYFLRQYEGTNCLLILHKNHMLSKNMVQKPLGQSKSRIHQAAMSQKSVEV